MKYKNKPVEEWGPEEYGEFWSQFIEITKTLRCKLCGKKIYGEQIQSHMEKNHFDKYKQHDNSLDQTSTGRPEKSLEEVQQD